MTIFLFYFLNPILFCFRYKGKGRPDAVMAEICWRAKHLFQGAKFERPTESMEQQGEEYADIFGDYRDSDNSDDDEL